jgi:hypothetical protein
MWHALTGKMSEVPQDRDLRLAVIDATGEVHALVFPSRYRDCVWVDARTGRVLELMPTHWQDWSETIPAPKAHNGPIHDPHVGY